ncbi:MAG TPA: hypothetical protein VHD90_07000 [Phototrophicaceae bacterium]|nr:hypothetical protein [Phototrophicaceae bacterium]
MTQVTGRLLQGNISVVDGHIDLVAFVRKTIVIDGVSDPIVQDEQISVSDETQIAAVRQFVESMLPAMSGAAGYAITLAVDSSGGE